jgi:phosphate transport system substrate-binding protein
MCRQSSAQWRAAVGLLVVMGYSMACGSTPAPGSGGVIRIDGSSTVYPLSVAVAQEFQKAHPDVRIDVAFSGTGAGFERFCKNESDFQDASRPISAREVEACKASGVGYLELPVALDAVTIIVPSSNTWAQSLTTAELKRIWEPAAQGKITRWRQIRPDWPDEPVRLFGPGRESGTFDFFTQSIVGTSGASRTDYTSSPNDDDIVNGVAGGPHALGYVGFVHYDRHRNRLHAARIDDLDQEIAPGAIEPSPNSVRRGLYRPLSRPLFIYVNTKGLDKPGIKRFVDYYTLNSETLAARSGTIPLNSRLSALVRQRAAARVEGSLFQRPDAANQSLEQLLDQ